MIRPLNYIAIDFETTGLDLLKDEPIQVGIVQFDHQRNIISTYESLIRPQKPRKELRSIVTYLTGFSVDELLNAPTPEQVVSEISHYFTENTVLIGHNVTFDIKVLNLIMDFTPYQKVDTLDLAQSLVHFVPSYSLDVIAEIIDHTYKLPENANYHQALTDSLAAYKVFRFALEKITQLRHEFMIIDHMIQNNTGMLSNIIKRSPKQFKYDQKKLFLPALTKEIKTHKRIINKNHLILDYAHLTKLDRSTRSIKDLFSALDREQHTYVFSFNERSKMLVAQQTLQQLGINHTHLFSQKIFDAERVNQFLQQTHFTDKETLFIVKYFSQYKLGHSLLDLNNSSDYKIFSALTISKTSSKKLPIVCTHEHLLKHRDNLTDEYTVLFFDHDWRYQTFRNWEFQPMNPLKIIQEIDNIHYQSTFDNDKPTVTLLQQLRNTWEIFIGVLGVESDKFFIGYPERKQEIDKIIDNPRFPKSTNLYKQLMQEYNDIIQALPNTYLATMQEIYLKAQTVLTDICIIEKKMYDGNKRWYLYHQADQYVDYSEFTSITHPGNWLLISGQADQYTQSVQLPPKEYPTIRLSIIPKLQTLINTVREKSGNWYILSTSKPKSQELFEHAMKLGLHQKYTILVENITGGVGKNCFKALHSKKPLIIIGGNKFFFEVLAQKIALNGIYVYHLLGNKKQLILADMLWYARNFY